MFLIFAMWLAMSASAQPIEGEQEFKPPGSDAPYEVGFHLGNLLPNQIDGATEIMGLGGLRGAYRLAPKSYAEGGVIMGNGEGVRWKNLHLDIRMDIPVETFIAVAYVGVDAIYYQGIGQGSHSLEFGGHAGGGLMVHLTGITWFRGDMKFGMGPGTSLYIGAGLQFRLGEGGQGGAN